MRSWSASLFFAYADCWFSHEEAQIIRSFLDLSDVVIRFSAPTLSLTDIYFVLKDRKLIWYMCGNTIIITQHYMYLLNFTDIIRSYVKFILFAGPPIISTEPRNLSAMVQPDTHVNMKVNS